MKKLFWLFLILQINSAHAQWLLNFSLNHAYDNNPSHSPDAVESWVSGVNLGLQYNFEPLSISYIGGFTRFDQLMERNFYMHQLAVFGTSGNTNWGVYADQRLNSEDYELYNYMTFTSFINHRHSITGFNLFYDAHIYLNQYSQLSDIDNVEINGGVKINKSFPSRTTLILGATLIHKRYLSATETITEITSDGSGRGNGPGSESSGSYLIYSEAEVPNATQLVALSRISQSLSMSTGLAVQYQKRFILAGASRFVGGLNDGYAEESQLFDDPIGYESDVIGIELTQLFPAALYLKTALYYSQKEYTTQGIFTDNTAYDESVLRSDTYKTAWLRIQKTFPLHSLLQGSLTLRLIYQWTVNSSNSYWYTYDNHYSALDVEFQF